MHWQALLLVAFALAYVISGIILTRSNLRLVAEEKKQSVSVTAAVIMTVCIPALWLREIIPIMIPGSFYGLLYFLESRRHR